MKLEDLAIEVRPRLPFEALDHGVVIAQHYVRAALVAWLLASAPVFVLAVGLTLAGHAVIGGVVLWWLKPFYDRALLLVYSRAVFGAKPGAWQVLRALPGLFDRGLLWQLTLARLSPLRSFVNPVRQLEGLRGPALRARVRTLSRNASGHAAGLAIVMVHLESVVVLGLLALGFMFIPQVVEIDFSTLLQDLVIEQSSTPLSIAALALYYAAITAIEPLFVAAGFALYLNQRTILEGWDLELGLRRLAARLDALPQAAALLFGCVLLATTLQPRPAAAAIASEPLAPASQRSPEGQAERSAQATQLAEDILADRLFDHWEEGRQLRFRFENEEQAEELDPDLPAWLASLGNLVAMLVKWVFWIGLAIALVYLLWRLAGQRMGLARRPVQAPPGALREAGELDLAEVLPPDVAAASWRLWQSADRRAALALLYRATLSAESRLAALQFPPSATEREVLRLARQAAGNSGRGAILTDTTRAWQQLAYGHRAPAESDFAALLERWQATYTPS